MLPSVPNPKYKDEECQGVLLKVAHRDAFRAVETGVTIVHTVKQLYPGQFNWTRTIDRLYGSDHLRKSVDGNSPLVEIVSILEAGLEEFKRIRANYLLYD